MICKEDIVSWFKDLESYRRIDIMCTLLNMCLPFELRFLGTCLEELGRRDSQELRGIELRVNNPQELASDIASCQSGEPTDLKIRRKMALYLALIRACNRSCVNELFKTLDSWGELDFQKLSDIDTLHELLLVYSMATNHPVFSFEQRSKCNEIFLKIQENKLISSGNSAVTLTSTVSTQSGTQLLNQQQQQVQTQHIQQQQQNQQSFGSEQQSQQIHLAGQLHNIHGGPQPLLHSIPILPPYLHQMIPADGLPHQLVDGLPPIIPNMAIPSDFITHPNAALWQVRPNMPSYPMAPPQPPTLEQHPPQSSSPMLSQPTSPSNSRTASPSRGSTNLSIQTTGNQQQQTTVQQLRSQQQQQTQQRIALRNSRRPSVETTPPPGVVQSQQQQQQQQQQSQQQQQLLNLIGGSDMILPQSLKNMDELINTDATISQFNRNGYTRPGHHTIPRQSKSNIQQQQHMQQHHNQQQQLQQQIAHQHLQSFLAGGGSSGNSNNSNSNTGPTSLPPNFTGLNPNVTYALQNMTLIDVHNPILENNIIGQNATNSLSQRLSGHKNVGSIGISAGPGSDSGSSASTGDISPPETPTLLNTNQQQVSTGNGGRLTDQSTSTNFSSRRLNGRPEKLISSSISSNHLMFTPTNATSTPHSQPQFHVGNDIILTSNPTLMQSPVSNNNNNSSTSNLISTIGSVVSGTSNNNLVTSTYVIATPQQQFNSGGTFPAPYHSQHLAAAMQTAAAAAAALGTPTRPPLLSHNPAALGPAGIAPATFRHHNFQMQSNGEHILFPYAPQVAAALSQFLPTQPPPSAGASGQTSIHRSSPSTVTGAGIPSSQQIVASSSQQQQTHSQNLTQNQTQSPLGIPPNQTPTAGTLLTAALPFTALTVGSKQIISCFNCGSQNHTGRDCQEPSLEDVTRGAIYKLDYSTSAVSPAASGTAPSVGNSSGIINISNNLGSNSNNSSNNNTNSNNTTTLLTSNNQSSASNVSASSSVSGSTTTSILNISNTNMLSNNSSNSQQTNSELLNETSTSPASSSSSLSLSNK